jgi:hypothetical protein
MCTRARTPRRRISQHLRKTALVQVQGSTSYIRTHMCTHAQARTSSRKHAHKHVSIPLGSRCLHAKLHARVFILGLYRVCALHYRHRFCRHQVADNDVSTEHWVCSRYVVTPFVSYVYSCTVHFLISCFQTAACFVFAKQSNFIVACAFALLLADLTGASQTP